MKLKRRKLLKLALLGLVAGVGKSALADPSLQKRQADRSPLSYVDPLLGTGAEGHTYPGAAAPFGMVQLSPDTGDGGWDFCSGYRFQDSTIVGFSHTHLSGTGCPDLLDVLLMPTSGQPLSGYRSRFSHAREEASPGYYRVFLEDSQILAEMTTTARVGLHRYTFPASGLTHFLVDLQHGAPGAVDQQKNRVKSSASLRVEGADTIVGSRVSNEWAKGREVHFVMQFSRPFVKTQLVSSGDSGDTRRCLLFTPTHAGEVILVKVAISHVSIEGARKNLAVELPGWDFEEVRRTVQFAWEQELGKITVEGSSEAHKRIFYTALYHTMLAPTLFSDVDGRYRGMDHKIHQLAAGAHHYTTYSLWDTYRAEHPLFTLIHPGRLPDMINSLLLMAQESPDGVPVWPLQGCETGCMVGYHSAVVVAEAYVKGVIGVDYEKAYALWRKRGLQDDYRGLAWYRQLGFVPCDREAESVSKTLEYAYDDWALAHLAGAARRPRERDFLLSRCRNYRNVFDEKLQFVRPRLDAGQWAEPFDPRAVGHAKKWRDFTESNSWQATFLNQHDLRNYIEQFGGDSPFVAKLDSLFSQTSDLPADAPGDISGMVGQYAHGNEPSHHVAYLYAYAGSPYKTQARVRSLLETLYTDKPDGLAGNEDCGQMSAWYVLSALGFYPVDPVSGNYVLGAPLFDRATIQLGNGKTLIISAINQGPENPYIQSLSWNGQACSRSWFSHAQIREGGIFEFTLGPEPNLKFAASREDRPPS